MPVLFGQGDAQGRRADVALSWAATFGVVQLGLEVGLALDPTQAMGRPILMRRSLDGRRAVSRSRTVVSMTTDTAEFDAVLALAAERSAAAEQMGRLDPDVVAAIARAGVNRSLLPAALGGRQAHPRELIDAVSRIAAADASTGWCVSISGGLNVFAGYVRSPPRETCTPIPTSDSPACSPRWA